MSCGNPNYAKGGGSWSNVTNCYVKHHGSWVEADEGWKNVNGTWTKFYDNKMRRRKYDNYQEVYTADGDGCGIHGTGAGFANLNKEEGLPEYDAVEWIDYAEAMEEVAA